MAFLLALQRGCYKVRFCILLPESDTDSPDSYYWTCFHCTLTEQKHTLLIWRSWSQSVLWCKTVLYLEKHENLPLVRVALRYHLAFSVCLNMFPSALPLFRKTGWLFPVFAYINSVSCIFVHQVKNKNNSSYTSECRCGGLRNWLWRATVA